MGPPVQHVITYVYTCDCSTALHTNSLLYAVTKAGLEAYTSRLYSLNAELQTAVVKAQGRDEVERISGIYEPSPNYFKTLNF